MRPSHHKVGSRHRPGDARATVNRVEDLFRRTHGVRRRAELAGIRRRYRASWRAAGAEQRRRRTGDSLRRCRWRHDQSKKRLCAQELLLSRFAEGLSDFAVRNPHRGRRLGHDRDSRNGKSYTADARAFGGRRGQKPARGLPRHDWNRFESRRHAAARDRLRARHAQRRRSGRLCQGLTCARALDRHLRRQSAGRELPL